MSAITAESRSRLAPRCWATTCSPACSATHADGAFAVVDVDELTCLDAAGARVLCAAASRAGRRMVVVNACPEVQHQLRLTTNGR